MRRGANKTRAALLPSALTPVRRDGDARSMRAHATPRTRTRRGERTATNTPYRAVHKYTTKQGECLSCRLLFRDKAFYLSENVCASQVQEFECVIRTLADTHIRSVRNA